MNCLMYSTNKSEKVAPKIEEILRKDLELTAPLPYNIEVFDEHKPTFFQKLRQTATEVNMNNVSSDQYSVGTAIDDAIFHSNIEKIKPIFTVTFEINQPRKVVITVPVGPMGLASGSSVRKIIFYTQLSKKINGLVKFEEPKSFGTPKFIGDPDAIAKLNSNNALLKLVDKFAITKWKAGTFDINIPRSVFIENTESGTNLVIATLPKPKCLGFKVTTDAKMFLEIASLIEAIL